MHQYARRKDLVPENVMIDRSSTVVIEFAVAITFTSGARKALNLRLLF